MTTEQEKAKENVKIFIKSIRSDLVEESKNNQELANDLETVLSMLQEQQEKIVKYEKIYKEYDCYRWVKKLDKKDKIIDLMADFIFQNIDVEEDICNSAYIKCKQETGQDITCINCIKQYFERKVEE